MINIFYPALFFILNYLLDSFPTGFLVAKEFTGKDIRKEESKNVGALNVMRVTGNLFLFLLTAIVDVGKGSLAVLIPQVFSFLDYNLLWAITLSGFGVVLGHCFSIYFKIKEGRFYGGKAQASLLGILAVLNFQCLFVPWAEVVIIFLLATQTFFLASLWETFSYPLLAIF